VLARRLRHACCTCWEMLHLLLWLALVAESVSVGDCVEFVFVAVVTKGDIGVEGRAESKGRYGTFNLSNGICVSDCDRIGVVDVA
jgi:hypothetical protein